MANELAGGFIWDAAAVQGNRKCHNYFGPDHINPAYRDCLCIDWPITGPLWLNPPYGKPEEVCWPDCPKKSCVKRGFHLTERVPGCEDFIYKAYLECMKGCNVWLLLAARTDNGWWHRWIWDENATDFRPHIKYRQFIRGRLQFKNRDHSAPFPSFLVQFQL